jgi:hypothetical protein
MITKLTSLHWEVIAIAGLMAVSWIRALYLIFA